MLTFTSQHFNYRQKQFISSIKRMALPETVVAAYFQIHNRITDASLQFRLVKVHRNEDGAITHYEYQNVGRYAHVFTAVVFAD